MSCLVLASAAAGAGESAGEVLERCWRGAGAGAGESAGEEGLPELWVRYLRRLDTHRLRVCVSDEDGVVLAVYACA